MFIADEFWDVLVEAFQPAFMDACFEQLQKVDIECGVCGSMDDYAMYASI